MSVGTIIELVAALALIVGAVMLYRRRGREDPQHGSQSAVLLLVVGAILLVHASGLLEYRPSPSELSAQ
jgi:ammonia channel protein AmtB